MANSTALIPWEVSNFPEPIQKELLRRKTNRSFNYQKIDGWDPNTGDWQKAKGPMTAWVRVCSNGLGRPEVNKPGFILGGAKSFYHTYGFQASPQGNQQLLGYTPDGKPHTIDNDLNSNYQIHVPSPEVVRVETIIQKELFRRAYIHWTCFSPKQLEYLTPYFLVPKISIMVEFGWNHFNPKSLIDLTDDDKLAQYYFTNPYPLYNENVLQSNGNYDVVYGVVTNFEWSIEGNRIQCMTEITSKDRLYSGVPLSTTVIEKKNPSDPKSEITYLSSIKQICSTDFIKNLKAIATADTLDSVVEDTSNQQLLQLIKGSRIPGKAEMKKEYWRGIFYGRDQNNIKQSSQLDHQWTVPNANDFDKTQSDDNIWVNMGFLVELLNRTLALPSGKKEVGFIPKIIN